MTPHDKNNLDFLMKSSPTALAVWWATTGTLDKQYAFSLLELARLDLIDRAIVFDKLTQSRKVLKLYTLKSRKK